MALPTLLVIPGPTAVGKTRIAVQLARQLQTEVLSADSRQFYREMRIGTARPSEEEMQGIPHHFIACRSIENELTAGQFELQALETLERIFRERSTAIMTGGSGLFIDAVCQGIDAMPETDPTIREALNRTFEKEGLVPLLEELRKKDPLHYETIDRNNPRRVIRALEVCRSAGQPYSSFRKGKAKKRPFRILKIGLWLERQKLNERIDARVDRMMSKGLLEESRALYHHRHLKPLNTLGYRELFRHLDGELSLEESIALIKQNTRRFAKRQMTWFRKDSEILWLHASTYEPIYKAVIKALGKSDQTSDQ